MLHSELLAIPSNHHTVRTLETKTTSHGPGASRYRTREEEQAFLTRAGWRRSRGRGAPPRQPARTAAGTSSLPATPLPLLPRQTRPGSRLGACSLQRGASLLQLPAAASDASQKTPQKL